jgi:hypothetical protein
VRFFCLAAPHIPDDMTGEFSPKANGGPLFPGDSNVGVTADQVMFKVNIWVSSFSP